MKKLLVLITSLALVMVLAAGCAELTSPETTQMPSPGLSTGTIKVLITDAPAYDVSKVEVTVSEVQVHKAVMTGNQASG